ncbi:MAG: NAD(P)-dependent oxidoreductase [Candidatus Limimorpha sp.]
MRIVFLEPIELDYGVVNEACECLRADGHEVVIFRDKRPELNIERSKGADIIVETDMLLDKSYFEACEGIKMLAIAVSGLDHIDLEECRKRGIHVANAAGYSTEAVAELAIAMMIDLYRKVIDNDKVTRSCRVGAILPGLELKGKTLGILGLGAIGRRTAELAKAFGCEVIAWNRTPTEAEGVRMVDKETLLKTSDIVSIHIALSEETRHLITAEELYLMKRNAVIINTSRGGIINSGDLAKALADGIIAGAALDVYDGEPPLFCNLPPINEDNPLLNAPNTLLLPHIGFGTAEAQTLRLKITIENIQKFINNNQQ